MPVKFYKRPTKFSMDNEQACSQMIQTVGQWRGSHLTAATHVTCTTLRGQFKVPWKR